MEYLVLLGITYAIYVFIAEAVNPFSRIRYPQHRKRRKLAITCAGALLVVGLISLLTSEGDHRVAVVQTVLVTMVITAPFIGKFFLDSQKT